MTISDFAPVFIGTSHKTAGKYYRLARLLFFYCALLESGSDKIGQFFK